MIPVPVERSTSYITGTRAAPDAILEASRQIELYNASVDLDLTSRGIVTLRPGISCKEELLNFLGKNFSLLRSGFPCFIGGEHSITPWILEGLGLDDIGIVWLDAHADLRGSYLGDEESHACAARNALRFGPMVEIGVRSYSKDEKDFLSESDGVRVFGRWSDDARNAVKELPDSIYLSLDYDVVDPSIIRAVGTPEPNGMVWPEMLELFSSLFHTKKVLAMDAVELCPAVNDKTSDYLAAKLLYEALSRLLKEEVRSEG